MKTSRLIKYYNHQKMINLIIIIRKFTKNNLMEKRVCI